jgi:hypothetical protein
VISLSDVHCSDFVQLISSQDRKKTLCPGSSMASRNSVNFFMSELCIVKPAADLVDDSCIVAVGALYFST